jgi:GGDEF domain-containing protein
VLILLLFFTGSILSTNSIVRGFFWVLVTTLLAFIAKSNGQNPPQKINRGKTQPKTASVTMSIGVAEADSNHSKPTSVMKAADQSL